MGSCMCKCLGSRKKDSEGSRHSVREGTSNEDGSVSGVAEPKLRRPTLIDYKSERFIKKFRSEFIKGPVGRTEEDEL